MQPTTQFAASLARSRAHTDSLFGLIRPDSLYERPIPERHRIIFYLGHLEAFDWNLCRDVLGLPAFQAAFDRLFAFGIDPPAGQLPSDQPSDWPAVTEVEEYNRRAREEVDRVLPRLPAEAVHVAVEHRWMHAETFSYMLHSLPLERKIGRGPAVARAASPPAGAMVGIPAGEATMGRRKGDGFGWDNEFDEHRVRVPAFAIGKHKVTNGEYLEFVRAGAAAPHFWSNRDGGWFYRGMFGDIPLPLDWPVYVTHDEAAAYARWRGKALPSEAQWHRAACGTPQGDERPYPWGAGAPNRVHGNFDFVGWDPVPVAATPGGDSAFGVSQMAGNGWEWTSTVFGPFDGFQPYPFYTGYSANFFDDSHYVMKGGSARTAAPLLRRSFRNWFRPDYPHTYAGFRLVEK